MKIGYIVGAGAQGRIIAEVWRAQHPDVPLTFVDDDVALHGRRVVGVEVIGAVERLQAANQDGALVILAIGDNRRRLELADQWSARGIAWGTAVHPSATLMPSAILGGGSVVFAHAVINTGAQVGRHVVINSAVVIEHDAVIEDGTSLSPGVCMGGRVRIERGAFISAGVTLAPRVTVGAGTIIGAGATVVHDIPPNVLAYGVPARVIGPLDSSVGLGRVL